MREPSFTITKGLAVILVVLSQAGAPAFIGNYVSQFAIPVLFLCAGYVFSPSSLSEVGSFIGRRVRGLYWPFWCWSLLFLILHNVFSVCQITKVPVYGWQVFFQRLWDMTFCMSGYDDELLSQFWFFRALLVASLSFFLAFKLLKNIRPADSDKRIANILLVSAVVLILWKMAAGLIIKSLSGGGFYELASVVFFAMGYVFKQMGKRVTSNVYVVILSLVVTILGACFYPTNLFLAQDYSHLLILLPVSFAGFVLLRALSDFLVMKDNVLARGLVFVGERALYVFAFYLLSFKLVSAVKIACYGLPWREISEMPVLVMPMESYFWIFYSVIGVVLPMVALYGYRQLEARVDMSIGNILRMTLTLSIRIVLLMALLIKNICLAIWHSILGTISAIKDIMKASSPKEE